MVVRKFVEAMIPRFAQDDEAHGPEVDPRLWFWYAFSVSGA